MSHREKYLGITLASGITGRAYKIIDVLDDANEDRVVLTMKAIGQLEGDEVYPLPSGGIWGDPSKLDLSICKSVGELKNPKWPWRVLTLK